MRIRKYAGLPGIAPSVFLPLPDDGTGEGGTGAGSTGAGKVADSNGQSQSAPATGSAQLNEHGYPDKTAVADMTAEQQASYWRHQNRKAEDKLRANSNATKELEKLQARLAELEEATATDAEKATKAAAKDAEERGRLAGLAAAREVFAPQILAAHIKAAADAKGLTVEALTTIVGPGERFATDTGIDVEALGAVLAAIPSVKAGGQQGSTATDLGGGRTTSPKADGVQAGRDYYQQRHAKRGA